jgi:putative peptide zinc metalloprotease protein
MAETGKLFHESWYRIANQRICLRPSIHMQRQMFRGSRWYVLRDPFSNQFYRLSPGAYGFVSRLNPNRTVEEVWSEVVDREPDEAPGQGDIIELLAQLYHANLLHYSLPPDSAKLFERYQKKKQRILQANLKSIMFFRVPLFDPNDFLQRLFPVIRVLMGPLGAIVWAVAVVGAIKVAIDHAGELWEQSQSVLAPDNLFLLYVGIVVIKTLHEFGHAFAVRRFGGEVHTMGVMFLIFSPLPYMDATASWFFRNKWHRVLVGAAGMIVEVFVAALALFIWAGTGPGIIHTLAYNMVFVASVSTVLFNINPLLRFDGYYILSDFLDMPNLHQHAFQHLKYLVEHHAFGCPNAETPATSRQDEIWFTGFGILSGIYRIVVFSTILLFVADQFLLAGLIMAALCLVTWGILPIIGTIRYLATSPKLHRVRSRAVLVSGATFTILASILFFFPFPFSVQAPGILKSSNYVVITNKVAGRVEEILAPSGTQVARGTPLLRLANKELEFELQESRAGFAEAEAQYRKAMQNNQSDLGPIASRMDYYQKRLDRLTREQADLIVTAETGGTWVAPILQDRLGMWVARGTAVGELVHKDRFQFVSVVAQSDISEVLEQGIRKTEVKLSGQAGTRISVADFAVIPMEQTRLPSVALGWSGGGDIAVNLQDEQGIQTAEPYYQVRANLLPNGDVTALHGRSGRINFLLPPKPLAFQGWRKLLQMVQDRYQL